MEALSTNYTDTIHYNVIFREVEWECWESSVEILKVIACSITSNGVWDIVEANSWTELTLCFMRSLFITDVFSCLEYYMHKGFYPRESKDICSVQDKLVSFTSCFLLLWELA